MDVVYILKPGELNEELRFSLRSLKNVPHDNVWFVGFQPSWVTNVKCDPYVPPKPPYNTNHPKWFNSWNLVRHACANSDISDEFILFNDDFFVMKPLEEIPTLHRGPIDDIIQRNKLRRSEQQMMRHKYLWTMHETQEILRSLEKPLLSYEVHAPMVIDRHKMLTVMEIAEAMRRPRQQCINKRSLYGNYWEIGGHRANGRADAGDYKVDSQHPEFDREGIFLSTTEGSFTRNPVGRFIRTALSKPSEYEKGSRRGTYNIRTSRTGPRPGVNRR